MEIELTFRANNLKLEIGTNTENLINRCISEYSSFLLFYKNILISDNSIYIYRVYQKIKKGKYKKANKMLNSDINNKSLEYIHTESELNDFAEMIENVFKEFINAKEIIRK